MGEKREQFGSLLVQAGERFRKDGVRTLIIVDGLDHVPREENPERSLLAELPLPSAMPKGVLILLGTQRLELSELAGAVRDQAALWERRINVDPLLPAAVYRMAEMLGLEADISSHVFELTDGHPLVARYLIEALRAASTSERQELLSGEMSFKDDLESVYASAWRGVENDDNARDVLGYLARAEGAIEPELLAKITSDSAVERALQSTRHLLRIEDDGWSVFHNSFRLFILSKPRLRFDKPDCSYSTNIYRKLAGLAAGAPASSQQHWLELRYMARAQEHERVLHLAQPLRFRTELAAGRSAKDIQADIGLALAAVKGTGDATALFRLLLARDEIERRATALSYAQNVVDAMLALGDLEAAETYAESTGRDQYKIVDALLHDGQVDRARVLFDRLDPLYTLSFASADQTNESQWNEWARRVHHFRESDQIEEALSWVRQQSRSRRVGEEATSLAETLRFEIGLAVARSSSPSEIDSALQALNVIQGEMPYFLIEAAGHARELGDARSGRALLMRAIAHETFPKISNNWRSAACHIAILLGDFEPAKAIFAKLKTPNVATLDRSYDEESPKSIAEDIVEYAEMGTLLGATLLEPVPSPESALRPLQVHATRIGQLLGRLQAGRVPAGEVVQTAREALAYLERAGPGKLGEYHTMMQLGVAGRVLQREILRAAARHSKAEFERVVAIFDETFARMSNPRVVSLWMRREFALEYYLRSGDAVGACRRLQPLLNEIQEQTPEGQIDELAQLAMAYALVGNTDLARNLLRQIQGESLGNALPPKKDPRYLLWLELLLRANTADPAARRDRVAFMIRQLEGMAQTEGDGSAYRIAADVLVEASRVDAPTAYAAAQVMGEHSLQPWCSLLNAILSALVERRPELVWPCAVTWTTLALPYYVETRFYRVESSGDFISTAVSAGKGSIALIDFLRHAIESESQAEMRCELLERLLASAEHCGASSKEIRAALARWQVELPDKGDGSTPGPYDNVDSLAMLATRMSSEESVSYDAPSAFARLVADGDLTTAREMFERWPELHNTSRARFALIERALVIGDRTLARSLLDNFKLEEEDFATWGSYMGGVRRQHFDLRSRVTETQLHRVAYEDLANELAAGRESADSVLVDFEEIAAVITAAPDWASLWECLVEQIRVTREYALGKPFSTITSDPQTDEELLIALYRWALSLSVTEVTLHARRGALALAFVENGQPIFAALTHAFLEGDDDEKLETLQLLVAAHTEIAPKATQDQVVRLIGHMDYAIGVMSVRLCEHWGVRVTLSTRELPAFYRLQLPPQDASRSARLLAGVVDEDVRLDDPIGWQQMFEGFEQGIADASGIPGRRLRDRALMLLNQWGGVDRFGTVAKARVMSTLRKLHMKITYMKPEADAAARAFRHVAGELRLAGRLERKNEPFLMHDMGYPTVPIPRLPPAVRPSFVPRPSLDSSSWNETDKRWLAAVNEDLHLLPQEGETVLAEVTRFEVRKLRTTYTLKRVRADGLEIDAEEDPDSWPYSFPRAKSLEGKNVPVSRERTKTIARWLSISGRPDMPAHVLVICADWLEHLQWRLHPRNPYLYVDRAGHLMAKMVWWRDGGPLDIDSDVSWGDGTLLILTRGGRQQIERESGTLRINVFAARNVSPAAGSNGNSEASYARCMEGT